MATYVTVVNGDSELVERARQLQEANRQAEQERQRDAALEIRSATTTQTATEDLQRPRGGYPDTDVTERPAATRPELTGIFAAEVTTRYDEDTDIFYVAASVPGVDSVVEVAADASGKGSVTTELPYTDPTLFTAYGRVAKNIDTHTWSIYRNGSYGSGTNYSDPYAEPPRTSNQTDISYPVSSRIGDQSASLLLPASSKQGILIYIHNRIEIYNKYTRYTNRVYSSVNERNIAVDSQTLEPYVWGDPGYFADWDAEGHTRLTYSYTGQETFAAYQIFAFSVSDKGVKQIDVPAALSTNLQELYPPVSVNGTASYLDEINFDSYYDHNPQAFVDVIVTNRTETYQNEPSFDTQVWEQSRRYGQLQSASYALPQHFGLGELNTSSHGGPYFTPAVFRFITGPMSLDNTTAQSYALMRSSYFPKAPFVFYAPCARSNACQDQAIKEFDLTRTQPSTATTQLATNKFRRVKKTDVVIGEPEGEILYAWDWGDPAYCQQKLAELGFSKADLKP